MSASRQGKLVAAAVGRKLGMLLNRVPRTTRRMRANRDDYTRRPSVVVTTVPKSGTHLVHQIVTALPGTVDYGTFLATTVSYRRKPRSTPALVRRIRSLAPGEILRSHLIHRTEVVDALRTKNAFTVFVYRDPRDVIVSEAHYLAHSAPWHSLHRTFARLTPEERIDVAVDGLPGREELYPDVSERFGWFADWLEDADVVLRFEDLVGEGRRAAIRTMVRRYQEASGADFDVDEITDQAIAAIAPEQSHTYREGRIGGWREAFSPEQATRVDAVAGDMLRRYGYVDQRSPHVGHGGG